MGKWIPPTCSDRERDTRIAWARLTGNLHPTGDRIKVMVHGDPWTYVGGREYSMWVLPEHNYYIVKCQGQSFYACVYHSLGVFKYRAKPVPYRLVFDCPVEMMADMAENFMWDRVQQLKAMRRLERERNERKSGGYIVGVDWGSTRPVDNIDTDKG